MAYEYDVFLSYKRHPEAKQWLVEHFEPLLTLYLTEELGVAARIFRDEKDIEGGVEWPVDLAHALSKSRALVALCSRTYFHSEWCSRELSTMMARETSAGLRTAANSSGLIVPVVLHDCEILPQAIAGMQAVYIRECFNVRMRKDSALAESLVESIRDKIAPSIKKAVESAPEWCPEWPAATAAAFLGAVRPNDQPRQIAVPRFA